MAPQPQQDPWADDPSFKAPAAGQPPAPAAAPSADDNWKLWQQNAPASDAAPEGDDEATNPIEKGVSRIGQSAGDVFKGVLQHPLKTIGGMVESSPPGMLVDAAIGRKNPAQLQGEGIFNDYKQNGPVAATEHLAGTIGGNVALGAALPAMGEAGSAMREAAMEDPNVAALRAMRLGPKSPDHLDAIKDVNTAKPYLGGAKSQADLQSRIPSAKDEVWAPYKEAVSGIGDRTVPGPDGPTTISALEAERVKTGALLRQLKAGGPEAIQLAKQKGMNQSDLLAREQAIQKALDPHLQAAGIDPRGIRNQFGSIARIGGRIEGQSTALENKPYGFGKIANISIKQPLKAPADIMSGIRDIAAGRPKWSGSPTDVGVSEAFRNPGPKPNFGRYQPPRIAGLLQAPLNEIPLSEPLAQGSTRGGIFNALENPDPMAANPEYPGIPRQIYDQGEIKPNPHYLSGSEHPELSGKYGPAKGILRTREAEGGAPETDEFGRIKINKIGRK